MSFFATLARELVLQNADPATMKRTESGDGIWRHHSWLFDTRKNQIVETTEPRNKDFGFTPNVQENGGKQGETDVDRGR